MVYVGSSDIYGVCQLVDYGIRVESIQWCTFWNDQLRVAFCRTTNAELSRISAPAYVAEGWLSRHARQAGKVTPEEIMIHVKG